MKLIIVVAMVTSLLLVGCTSAPPSSSEGDSDVPVYTGADGTGGVYVVMPEEQAEALLRSVSTRFDQWTYVHVEAHEFSTPANVFGELYLVRNVNQSGSIGGIAAGTVVEVLVELYAGGDTTTSPPSGGTLARTSTSSPVTIIAGVYSPVTITLPAAPPTVSGVTPPDGSTVGTGFTLEMNVTPGCAASGTPENSITVDGVPGSTLTSTTPGWAIGGLTDGATVVVVVRSKDTSDTGVDDGVTVTTLTYTVDASLGDGGVDVGIQSVTS